MPLCLALHPIASWAPKTPFCNSNKQQQASKQVASVACLPVSLIFAACRRGSRSKMALDHSARFAPPVPAHPPDAWG